MCCKHTYMIKGFVTTKEPEGNWKPGKAELYGEKKIDRRTLEPWDFFLFALCIKCLKLQSHSYDGLKFQWLYINSFIKWNKHFRSVATDQASSQLVVVLNWIVETGASELGHGSLLWWVVLCLRPCTRGTHGNQGAPSEDGNPVKALWRFGQCPAGRPWVLLSCGCYFELHHLLKRSCRPSPPFHQTIFPVGRGLFRQHNEP